MTKRSITYPLLSLCLSFSLSNPSTWAAESAAGVVGSGTAVSCNEAALSAALAGGGTVTFDCGPAPHTILSSLAKPITVSTTIDGGGTITLDGQGSDRLFVVSNGAVLTLRNIVLAHGFSNGDGGAIHNGSAGADTPGAVVLENSTIRDSIAGASGGAIVSTGPLTITNSLLESNRALNGGALYPRFGGARTTIINSTLRYNTATDTPTTNGWGGAMLIWEGAAVTLEGSQVYSNTARQGGGVYVFAASALTITATAVRDNRANTGGGLYNSGTAALTDVTVSGNTADFAGGGLRSDGTLTLTAVTLSGNTAQFGGGIFNDGAATLARVTFSDNSAAAWGGGLRNGGQASLTNVTFSGNTAGSTGGGAWNNPGFLGLRYVTFTGNAAGVSGGAVTRDGGSIVMAGTIVANSPSGGNCAGAVLNDGFNLSTDATCGSFSQVADVLLGPLANNGGVTQTHLPQPGSPAIDFVAVGCPPPTTDQRGGNRPVDGDNNGVARCDAGAVERQGVGPELTSRVYLTLLTR